MDNKSFFNSLAEKWDSICYHPSEKVNYVIDKIGLKNGDSVLDIGSGTGITIPYLEKRIGINGKITALDIAEKCLKFQRRKTFMTIWILKEKIFLNILHLKNLIRL